MSTKAVTLKELAREVGIDRSHMRRFVILQKIETFMIRTLESRGQKTLAISAEDADLVRKKRQEYVNGLPVERSDNGHGVFYVVQLVPDLAPNRIKLGYASSIEARLQAHKTSAPTAELVEVWPCKKSWEQTIIDSVTRIECVSLSGEVFDCEDLGSLLSRCSELFSLLPEV